MATGSSPMFQFPDPGGADEDGLVAIGGDLSPERLLSAYRTGIFPWFDDGLPPLWWSPDPRAIIEPARLHVSRSMRRLLGKGRFVVTFDRAFPQVIDECARCRREGTWILPEMIDAYVQLHRLGHAHSFEVWEQGELVGGLYGVHQGGLFAAESMYHRRSNASKVALIASVTSLARAGIELYDVQFLTPHLQSLGAREISRSEYLQRVGAACHKSVRLESLQLQ